MQLPNNLNLNNLQPREKLEKLGINYLSDEELLALILESGNKHISVYNIASKIIKILYEYKTTNTSLQNLREKLLQVPGVGPSKVSKILATLELNKRLIAPRGIVVTPNIIYEWFYFLTKESQEHLYVVLINTALEYIDHRLIYKGNINGIYIANREIFVYAYQKQAPGFLLVHNHPSGDYMPSSYDIQITRNLQKTGRLIGLTLYDHIIVAKHGYLSFKQTHLIQ